MTTICLVQSRLSSERFPAKVLELINGQPMLWHVYQRAKRIEGLDDVVIATSFAEADQRLVQWCQTNNIPVLRGGKGENDVLGRYHDIASLMSADTIVRITGDCPLLDPWVSGKVLEVYHDTGAEFASNRLEQPYPDGYDTEVMNYGLLSSAYWEAVEAGDREHVTPWLIRHTDAAALRYGGFPLPKLSVDTPEDLALVREIYAALGDDCGIEQVTAWLTGRLAKTVPVQEKRKHPSIPDKSTDFGQGTITG